MSIQSSAQLYGVAVGSSSNSVSTPFVANRAPTAYDVDFPLGKRWIYSAGNEEYALTSISTSSGVPQANWELSAGPSLGSVDGLMADDGFTATPDAAGIITVAGTSNQIVTTASGNTLTLAFPSPQLDVPQTVSNSHAAGAATVTYLAQNTDPLAATSHASFRVETASGAGDPFVDFAITTGQEYVMGIDNSSLGDDFLLCSGAAIGTNTLLTVTNTGNFVAAASIGCTGNIIAVGPGDIIATNGDLTMGGTGNKLNIVAGANCSIGTATLVGGTVTVANTAVETLSLIFVSRNTPGGTPGHLSAPVGSIVNGTSFVINSSDGADTSTVNWWFVN